ncbi:family 16 glycosylhydrolase [Olleya sp. YS]|uniref:family 16 glycosylhydrolase n=1 Tax=Olleya sp. YS TaxID=3028318 RepID=UPI00243416E5|nr:family 16 glycosylhydrolase [Olleya sp. YS]WGD34766.1 family 16 glycosylhydrolase [Olleya sp. YS]
MRHFYLLLFFLCSLVNAQVVQDDFEGGGTITSWYGDNCGMNINYANPYQQGINTSNTVLEYSDVGGQYANVQFDVNTNFDLTVKNSFSLKIYVPSSGLTGNQTNQISLKLQDKNLAQPWTTQSEIIKPIALNAWQEVTFDFENDNYINLDGNSPPPVQRTDFNRVVIQVNGENNYDYVLAYLDDVLYYDSISTDPIYDNLVWSDEFDGSGAIDTNKWFMQTQLIAGDSWANGEQQHYTNRIDNAYRDNGSLKIVAKGETYTDQGVTKNYTSARLNSKFSFKNGRVEIRAKLPSIAGTWPAMWLLGKNINEDGGYWDNQGFGTTSWPACGEIDIMEPNIAKNQILATWHWDNGNGYMYDSNSIATSNADTSQNFHIYELVWSEQNMKIYMDGTLINQLTTVDPFNQEFYILLNVAMGGNLGGPIQSGFNQDTMEIDYVRVYQESTLSVSDINLDDNILVFPNPATDILNIKISNTSQHHGTLQVLDVAGRLVTQKQFNINNTTLVYDTSALNAGIYFMKLEFDNNTSNTFKFIKE